MLSNNTVMHSSRYEHHGLSVILIPNGPFVENCYLVFDETSRAGIVIDPGDEETQILDEIREHNLHITEIINTHGHIDHIGAVAPLKRLLGVPFAIHRDEQMWVDQLASQLKFFGLPHKETPTIDRFIAHGDRFRCGRFEAEVRVTPGHSAGGCCFYFAEVGVVFVGDTLFSGSIGRTDLPGGDLNTLLASIRRELFPLDDSVVAYSGHGPRTTIGEERATNPFLAT